MNRSVWIALATLISLPIPAIAQPASWCGIPVQNKLQAQVFATLGGNQDYRCTYTVTINYQDGTQSKHIADTYVSTGGTNRLVLGVSLPKPASTCSVEQSCVPQ